ncbi:hypothetical protein HK099_008312 [Clydaea vesicula]|uniref:Phosphatidyl-N-methylethanolamine N-methyltransferase n=1 Tax=Clydaea vesicula TaxID=447962 RepID=A0AAD5U7V5_9FUNG|nr:hypothetical protein HK099_008312 [Clydaea vesicula]
MEAAQEYVSIVKQVVSSNVMPAIQPHLDGLVELTSPLHPYYLELLTIISPLIIFIKDLENALPNFESFQPKLISIFFIVFHVLFYNSIARLEFNTKIFTKIFGRSAVYVNALLLILSALIRDHYVMRTILLDAGSKPFFDLETSYFIGSTLCYLGIFLNLWTLYTLGFIGMYNGDSFGYLMDAPVSGGPYVMFDDPQYFGTTMVLLGYAIINQSRLGYGLAGVLYIVFHLSVSILEGPHMEKGKFLFVHDHNEKTIKWLKDHF